MMNGTVRILFALALLAAGLDLQAGDGTASCGFNRTVDYNTYFTGERLRIDIALCGDNREQCAFLSGLHREAAWAGSPYGLIDKFGYGQYFFEVFCNGELIYSHGFCTLFEEWRSTREALNVRKTMNQSLWMPFPKEKCHVVLYERIKKTGMFSPMFEFDIDPRDRHISNKVQKEYRTVCLLYNGDPSCKVDLVFSGEGYTASQMDKLNADAVRMMDYLFSMEPYRQRRNDFNVYLIESVSADEGTDIPQNGIWKDTAMDSGFDTFYEDRYLTIQNQTGIADVYSATPFDALFIIANEEKYGGGGIYNSYAMGSSDHKYSLPVFIHEFGHSFAGLGDEYYDSSTAYDDEYYPLDIEPWEPNISTLRNFSSKWSDMIKEGTPIPTPNDPSLYGNTVGVFEGAGYMVHGCYRPFYECRMLNNTAPAFCPVCRRAIERMIDFYVSGSLPEPVGQ